MTESYWNRGADPYQYPGSQVLRNLPGINDASALEVFEQRASALRLDEMLAAIADKSINLALWQTIHRILFQDVYDWAGNIRLVQLAKGDTVFAMPERIEVEVNRLFAALERENLPSLNRDQIVARLAHYFGELNVLHPFREGNGRTQKLLFDEIVRRAGYAIDWAKMDVDALLKAVIAAFQKQDYHALERLFIHAIGD